MAQLKMYRLAGMPLKEYELPDGYSVSKYKNEKDKLAWVECCKNGLVADDADEKAFDEAITDNPNINVFNDVFFLDYGYRFRCQREELRRYAYGRNQNGISRQGARKIPFAYYNKRNGKTRCQIHIAYNR